ncbi:hypothetical protein LTR91_014092 [Friedmanniomyces endolithicus]|uniref:Uncharacterized protein n=1 Tax=Friedmanniomyces endolithicus TaxID=329885 RepID=A0AAN6QPR3_9PEZI|nr:hypothetical protein LTR91_014092 [Friedmanniomyces endolithicus]
MSIFKRKPKADKDNTEKGKKASKENAKKQTVPDKPTHSQPYKPTHAASDAVRRPTTINGRNYSRDAADYAQGSANLPLAPNGNQPFTHAGMRPVVMGVNPLSPIRNPAGGFTAMQRNNSAEVFTTDPEAPPMPTATISERGQLTPHSETSRQNGGYFSQQRNNGPSFDSQRNKAPSFDTQQNNAPSFDSPMLGNTKMAVAARDHQGYVDPHTSADSGYGSIAHSRAPSEQMNLQSWGRPHLPRDNSGFLPEMSLSEELAREPAFSESSFGADEAVEAPMPAPKQPESVLKNGRAYQSQLDPGNEWRSTKAGKSGRVAQKQTRFEPTPEKLTSRQLEENAQILRSSSSQYSQAQYAPEVVQDSRPKSTMLPQPDSSAPPLAASEDYRSFQSAPVNRHTSSSQRHLEPQSQYTTPARLSTPPTAREREQVALPVRLSSPPLQYQHTAGFAPLERVLSPSLRSSQAPSGSLEGLKVNKRGKVLDEEGEVIGELVEGDIMDCVRQRCNAYGEVLDDRGRVVGHVQSIEQRLDSPILRMVSPLPLPAPAMQQQHGFAPQTQQPLQRPVSQPERKKPRRESAASQREVFTPAWQRQSHNNHAGLAWELRDHIASSNQKSHAAIAPAEYPGSVTAVELDGSGAHSDEEDDYDEDDDVTPIMDYSDVFMPVPIVPPRSARRSETPSPPVERFERVERQWAASQLIQSATPGAAQDTLQDPENTPSRYVSAPPAPRQRLSQEQLQGPAATSYEQGGYARSPEYQQPETQSRQRQAPSKHTAAVASAIVRAFSPPPKTQPEPARQPIVTPAPVQQAASQTLLRSESDSSLNEMAKSYARPSMSPVLEGVQTVNKEQERSPALFSYKGAIPAADGPAPNAYLAPSRALGAKSPSPANSPRQALTGGVPASSPFVPMNSAQFTLAGSNTGRGMPPRQFSTGVPGVRQIPNFQHKTSFNAPLKRSPLSSHEITPPESDAGHNDGDRNVGLANGMHSRQPSLRSMRSMQSALNNGKPRTYFTHGGRVAVGVVDGEQPPSQMAVANSAGNEVQKKEPTPSVSGASTAGKKKNRFSLGFGKKS